MAQRTRELPAWLQKENTAPDVYAYMYNVDDLYLIMCVYLEQVLSESGNIV